MEHADLFDDPRLTDVGLLFEASRGIRMKLESTWTANGLSLLDFIAIMRLSRSPGTRLRMTDLAAQTQLSTSGVTRLVDRLERNGLVRREPDPADRRSSYTVLTHAGAARLAKVLPEYLEVIDQWFFGPLTPEQRDALVSALRIIRDASFPEASLISE
ncbi:MarR family winged helix-turn-helix transcriptional regulator [Nocardia pseudobrasiliensis]|uniref:DNA-binding MarR family transcriptional regulator n=1 Tax=Nocardia pseudobrasiliensis TaxID=45979 RepID=A0A370I799_9NOCA|nr:MarR family transcriptional regulator [Nocardia pseudobrasiliensis]RDI66603.1 DNA-binding MarR family transcriptional regulator [Nocardia pseudobrasiliensis]